MNKELEEAISICKAIKKNIRCNSTFDLNILKLNRSNEEAIKIAINYIENSIPKEKIKKKIEEYKEIADEDNRDYFIRIDTLQELLEGK